MENRIIFNKDDLKYTFIDNEWIIEYNCKDACLPIYGFGMTKEEAYNDFLLAFSEFIQFCD